MIKSFKLALGLTTCLSGITLAEARPNTITEELRNSHVSHAAKRPSVRSLIQERKKQKIMARISARGKAIVRSIVIARPVAPTSHVTKRLSVRALIQERKKQKIMARRSARGNAIARSIIIASPAAHINPVITRRAAVTPKKVTLINQATEANIANDNITNNPAISVLNTAQPIVRHEEQAVNNPPLSISTVPSVDELQHKSQAILAETKIAEIVPQTSVSPIAPEEVKPAAEEAQIKIAEIIPQTSASPIAPEEVKPAAEEAQIKIAEIVPQTSASPIAPEEVKPAPIVVETKPVEAVSQTSSIVENRADDLQLRTETRATVNSLKDFLQSIDLDTLALDTKEYNLFLLSQISPRLVNLLGNYRGSEKGGTSLIDSLKSLKTILSNGNIDIEGIRNDNLKAIKAYSLSAVSEIIALNNSTHINYVQKRLVDVKDLLKDFVPGVSLMNVSPKDVPVVKLSLWNLREFLTNTIDTSKGGVHGVFMNELITETKAALEKPMRSLLATSPELYPTLMRTKASLENILDKLKFEQPSGYVSEQAKPAMSEAVAPSAPLLPVLDRAKPVFSRLQGLLEDPKFSATQESESLMSSIIGQLNHINEVKANIDENSKDKAAILRTMLDNIAKLSQTTREGTMALGIASLQAAKLIDRLEGK